MTGAPGPWPAAPPPQCPSCSTPAARPDARFCRACGATLNSPGTAPAAAAPGRAPALPPPRRPFWKRPRTLAALGAAVVVAVLAATCQRTVQEDTDPAAPVADLLELVTARQGGALADEIGVSSPLITDDALARGYQPPKQLRSAGVSYGAADAETRRPDRGTATVTVAYSIGGREHRTAVRVQREATGWVRDWEVTDASGLTGALTITSTHLDQARAAGAQVPTTPPESRLLGAEQAALPGTYTITTSEQHTLFAAAEVGTAAVTDQRTTTFDIATADLQVRSGLADDVTGQVAARLEECAEETSLAPPGCPLRLERDSYRTVEDVSWRVTAQPQIRLVPAEDPALRGAPLAVETTDTGSAEVTYRPVYGADEPEQETVEITIGGSVSLTEDGRAVWDG